MPEILPTVQNVVSFVRLNNSSPLDLQTISKKVNDSRYNPKRFPAVILRKTKPKSTILIFQSGKMIIIGSQSQRDAFNVAQKSTKDIEKYLGLKNVTMEEFKVTNIVANAQLGWRIDLHLLQEKEGQILKGDLFPGVVFRKNLTNVKAALLFTSGKVVFTGAQKKQHIDNAFQQLKQKLRKYMVKPTE